MFAPLFPTRRLRAPSLVLLLHALGCGGGDERDGDGGRPPAPYVPPACVEGRSFSTAHDDTTACGRPIAIGTGFGGNGHTESWDGRVFIVTKNTSAPPHAVGWVVRIFRPERLVRGAGGAPDFGNQAFSEELVLETDANGASHNAIAVIAAPGFAENPFASDASGNASHEGAFHTYELILYAQNYEQNSILQQRRLRVVVRDPLTVDARVESATFLEGFTFVKTVSDDTIHAIEPTLTADGRLLIAQGHPINDGRIDYLVYSWNASPGSVTGWSEPRFITDMYAVDRDTWVDGIRFADRFPIAQEPLRDQDGVAFTEGEPFHGAYPWISHDGTELFYMATVAGNDTLRPGERARRGGASVVGRFTRFAIRHIDGPINPSRDGATQSSTVRLFFSSPGATGTMWAPYHERSRDFAPYTAGHPVYPLFGSNTGNYTEVGFEDTLDGDYVLALRMNELVGHDSNVDETRTPDTSGHFNTGALEGARFPLEHDGNDEIVGISGQALYFPETGAVRVAHAASLEASEGLTVSLFVKRVVDMAVDAEDRARFLVRKAGVFELLLEEDGRVRATVHAGGSTRTTGAFGPALPLGAWIHVAFSYDAASGDLVGYRDGEQIVTVSGSGAPLDASTNDVLVGPDHDTTSPFLAPSKAIVLLDELLVSRVARTGREIARDAYRCAPPEPSAPLASLPLGLSPADLRVPADNLDSEGARALGRALFFDTRLSGAHDTSCATCHLPDRFLTDGRATALGVGPRFLSRNTPSLFNRAFGAAQFWDGASASLEEQALVPIENPAEMNLPLETALARIASVPGYVSRFESVFGAAPSGPSLARALAAYERSLLSGDARVDRYEAGDASALDASEIRGRAIFRGPRGRCLGCHGGSNYTDELFHNNGATCVADVGRIGATGRDRDLGLFKTPSLRDVAETAPYMHDGSLDTLADVIAAYDAGGHHTNRLDTEIRPLGLTAGERRDLEAFLRALTGSTTTLEIPTPVE